MESYAVKIINSYGWKLVLLHKIYKPILKKLEINTLNQGLPNVTIAKLPVHKKVKPLVKFHQMFSQSNEKDYSLTASTIIDQLLED